jgi:hypothetical protein
MKFTLTPHRISYLLVLEVLAKGNTRKTKPHSLVTEKAKLERYVRSFSSCYPNPKPNRNDKPGDETPNYNHNQTTLSHF